MSANGFEKFYVGLNLMGLEDNGIQRPISRVTLLLDDENVLTAGDDTGLEITADCPHATQAMVNALLEQLKGSRYKMYSSTDAKFDPAAELGDGITVGDIYSSISRISDDGMGFPSPSAPGKEELEDEYPAGGPMTQTFNRKISETRSSIKKTAEQIRLEVEKVNNDLVELSTSFTVNLGKITSDIQDINGNFSRLEQTIDSFTLTVDNGSTYSTIKLLAGNVEIASQNIFMNGLVTFSGLEDGTTTINGGCIKTGTIKSMTISSSSINGGTISGGSISGGTITGASISGGSFTSTGNYSSFTRSTVIDDGFIKLSFDGENSGTIGTYASGLLSIFATEMLTVSAGSAGSSAVQITAEKILFSSRTNELFDCYNNIDMHNYSILNTSDKRLKKNIVKSNMDALSVINSIGTYSFDWLESGIHENIGFIAQQLEKINPDFVHINPKDGHYSTKDIKIIPYLVKAVQELSAKIGKLEGNT